MEITSQTAKGILQRIISLARCPPLVYTSTVESGPPPQSVCTLEVPGFELQGNISEPQRIRAAGPSKKAASCQAALIAMNALITKEWVRSLLEEWDGPATLVGATTRALSHEALRKDPDLEGNLVMAQKYNSGWLPRALLAKSKFVPRWYKERAKQPHGVMHICKTLIPLLQAELADMPDAEIEVDAVAGMIRRKTEYAGRVHTKTCMLPALLESNALGDGKEFTAVNIPTDDRMPVKEVSLTGGTWHLQAIAAALNVDLQSLACWGREGKSYCTTMHPEEPLFDVNSANDALKALIEKHMTVEDMREPPSEKAASTGKAFEESLQSAEKALREDITREEMRRTQPGKVAGGAPPAVAVQPDEDLEIKLSPRLRMQELRSPFMYGVLDEAAPINRRASWLVGCVVRGPVVLSYTYVRPMPQGLPVIKWASFSERTFWRWLGGSAPHTVFLNSVGYSKRKLLTWMPHAYNTWLAPGRPRYVLDELSCPGVMEEAPKFTFCPTEDIGDTTEPLQTCEMSCKPTGVEKVLRVGGRPAASQEAAYENAALEMFHLLQALWRDMFFRSVDMAEPEIRNSFGELGPGKEDLRPMEGGAVFFNYTITSPELRNITLEDSDAGPLKMMWGETMMCLPEVHLALNQVGIEGKVQVCMPLPLDGKAVAGAHTPVVEAVIDLELVKCMRPVERMTKVSLFNPPMSSQRYTFVTDVLKAHHVRSVVDMGCGAASLMDQIILDCPAVEDICGMDKSPLPLERAEKRLAPLLDGSGVNEAGTARTAPPRVRFMLGDAFTESRVTAGGWDDVGPYDAVILTEVIEHLDPEPLALVPAAILGCLKPRLVVITTPNKDYNPIMHKLGVPVPPGRFRNSDHRFEWSQEDFRKWADTAAAQHGYCVTYSGIGRAKGEETVLNGSTPEKVGASTQVAVFTRKEESASDESVVPVWMETGSPPPVQGSGKRHACDEEAGNGASSEGRPVKLMKAW